MRLFIASCVSIVGVTFGELNFPVKVVSEFHQMENLVQNYKQKALLVFLGSSSIEESNSLLLQIKDKKFEQEASSNFIVYWADLNFSLMNSEEIKNYENLIAKYNINSFPTMVLCDSSFDEISRFGYSENGSVSLVKKINEASFSYDLLMNKVASADEKSILELYRQASNLGCMKLKNYILDLAFQKDVVPSELKLEKYISLIRQGVENIALKNYKEKYLTSECSNSKEFLQRVAIIDFQFSMPLTEQEKIILQKSNILVD